MADIWSGDILLPNGRSVTDVGLASLQIASRPFLPTRTLRFLSTVDTTRIPLYLAAGPSLDVWTTNEATEEWFESLLLCKPDDETEWWSLSRAQSPIGILAEVQLAEEQAQSPRVTEILFYGTIATPPSAALPTPPSSSPRNQDALTEPRLEFHVHALPLSSDLLHRQDIEPTPYSDAHFLPPRHGTCATPRSPKRKRDIFEEATIANRKAKGKGGHGVAAAAARGSDTQQPYTHRKSLSIDTRAAPLPHPRPLSANGASSRSGSRQLSRSPSISSDTRPMSRKDLPDTHNKRSNLSQVATISLKPEEPTLESRNKEALSRVVMAAMRMHGLQQRNKTKSRRVSVAPDVEENRNVPEEAVTEEFTKEEEYKLIYHQTYKGAALALRKHMSQKPLHSQPDRLRDVVEKLLAIFLVDPLTEPQPANTAPNPIATPGTKDKLGVPSSAHPRTSPFDLPSVVRAGVVRSATNTHMCTGSPVSRRRPGMNMPTHV